MKTKNIKKILSVLNKIESMKDVESLKQEYKKKLKKENSKPHQITVEWVGCYELMRDGTKYTTYCDAFEVVTEEMNILEWNDPIIKNRDIPALTKAINEYTEANGLGTYSENDVKKNLLEDLVEHLWEDRETMSCEVYYD